MGRFIKGNAEIIAEMEKRTQWITYLIAGAIVVIFGLIIYANLSVEPGSVSYGINGRIERRCINGKAFMIGENGRAVQEIGPNGGSVPCND